MMASSTYFAIENESSNYAQPSPLIHLLHAEEPVSHNESDRIMRSLLRPWPIDRVFGFFVSHIVTTSPVFLCVTYSTDDNGRRHTQVDLESDVWSYTRRPTTSGIKWSLAYFAIVPPERNFKTETLLEEIHGKGVAARTARAIEVSHRFGLDWFVCHRLLDVSAPAVYMAELASTLVRLHVMRDVTVLARHLVDGVASRTLSRADALACAAHIMAQ